MAQEFTIRTVRTASGAKAVQIIRHERGKRTVVQHVGSAHTDDDLAVLQKKALIAREKLCKQLPLFPIEASLPNPIHTDQLQLTSVTHCFAYEALRACLCQCGLGNLPSLYQDLALMRIIEPASKLRTIELLERYFSIIHKERTVYRLLPKLLQHKEAIEHAAYQTASTHFQESFALVLYDVTTLYFESHEPDDELLAKGFSKDDKSKQPQIVVGLLVTSQGFPIMHEVFKGNTFEGHTMLGLVEVFQARYKAIKPIIVADAAMLSYKNMQLLEEKGYPYIVGARLANTASSFIDAIAEQLIREDKNLIRLPYLKSNYEVICTYSEKRFKKDRFQFEKQLKRAEDLIARKEPVKRAKFVKKSDKNEAFFVLDEDLKKKTEKLLGIKGYCTNIPETVLSSQQVVDYYHDLWRVEQAFRMSKTDLKTRPIFHRTHDAIKAHVLICFMALMMGKFLEIKANLSLRRIRDILWNVHEAHIEDLLTGKQITLRTHLDDYRNTGLDKILKLH